MALRSMIERAGAASAPAPSPAQIAPAAERCGLCAAPVPDRHRHVLDLDAGGLMCACRACALLFEHQGAGRQGRHWRLVPETCVALPELKLDDLAWRSLGLPVQLAFFVRRQPGGVSAFYPSPAGATECSLELDSWAEIESDNPELGRMEAEVEALLVDRTGGGQRAFLVGLDDCYRLVGAIRTTWRGFSGGELVWHEIDAFFDRLAARAGTRK